MTRPTARVLALLELLQSSPRTRTVADLAGRLGVDERTVRRYVSHLADLDIPVESVRGRYGGLRLAPGYRTPPLMLTDEEALAVLLGLLASRRAGLANASTAVAETAASKVRRVLPVRVARRLEELLQARGDDAGARPAAVPQAGVLLTMAEAVRARRPVALRYTDASGRTTERTVHPHGIVAHDGRWYASAVDATSGDVRSFRVDRVEVATVLAGTFEAPDTAEDADVGDRVRASLSRVPWRHEVALRVQGTADRVAGVFPPGLVTVEGTADGTDGHGWVRVVFRAERLDWVPGLLAALPVPFVVEGPEELRALVRTAADRLSAAVAVPPSIDSSP